MQNVENRYICIVDKMQEYGEKVNTYSKMDSNFRD